MSIDKVAQEMVEATFPIVSGRTINIMDKNGIIIASSDTKRIGVFHKGAAEVISSRKVVRIFKNDISRYKGAKEGINMPIIIEGNLFGVVGIQGNPDEVSDVANLLCVYVGQYFAQNAIAKKEKLQSELRLQLLKLIIFGQKFTIDDVHQICSVINFQIRFPMRVIVISLGDKSTERMVKVKCLDKIAAILTTNGYIDLEHDIYGVVDECFVLLKSTANILLDNVYRTIKAGQSLSVSVAMGELSESFTHIQYSYNSALTLALVCGDGYFSMDSNKSKLSYLMYSLEKMDKMRFSKEMYGRFVKHYGEKDMDWVMTTIQTYCDTSGSINKASDILHIHKNTMLYRMKKIYLLMDVENEDKFTKECFLHILLVHHNSIKG